MCGCNRSSKPSRATPALRPISNARSLRPAPAPTNNQIISLGIQSSPNPASIRQMDTERRKMEKMRREAIKKTFGK